MVIVRESPRVEHSPDDKDKQWPPKSPFAALMSSPSGRKKWQDRTDRDRERTPSPSPLRRPIGSPRQSQALSPPSDQDEEEDEETMRLRLAEIQAKLKIKELQRKAKRTAKETSFEGNSTLLSSTTASQRDAPAERKPAKVEVPLSPLRIRESGQEHLSPARKRLGLQDVRRAEDVSLKRGPKISSAATSLASRALQAQQNEPRSLTFSERLAASKSEARAEEAKQDRIDKSRSAGFGNVRTTYSQAKTMIERRPRPVPAESKRPSSSHALPTTSSQSSLFSESVRERRVPQLMPTANDKADTTTSQINAMKRSSENTIVTDNKQQASCFDPHSEIHLSKRHITHVDVAREMDGREIYTLPRLLKEVKAPHYDPPDCESDFVVFAILASKSTPYQQKATHRTSDELAPQDDALAPRNKFMVFKLCDLKWEIDCFLFGTAFDQFWKLTPGTLVAILNPGIMAPKNNSHNGRFSLKLGSSEDCVMEIGIARDLGYCDSIKKDGKQCAEWVDKRSTQICEFHLNLLIDKERKGRMEVNTMFRGAENGKNQYRTQSRNLGEKSWEKQGKKRSGDMHPEYGRLYSVPAGIGHSAASLLDREDPDALHGMTREEASRKRIAAAEKERELAKRLGQIGNGPGAEYLRVKHNLSSDRDGRDQAKQDTHNLFEKPKASDLGLLDNKATDIRLSPAKDRKRHFGLGISGSTTTAGGAAAMGWGGAKKVGLLQSKDTRLGSPEKGQTRLDSAVRPRAALVRERSSDGSLSPKKRARFALEKGIREPGRESLGGDDLKAQTATATHKGGIYDHDDDDDELDIV